MASLEKILVSLNQKWTVVFDGLLWCVNFFWWFSQWFCFTENQVIEDRALGSTAQLDRDFFFNSEFVEVIP